MRKVVVRIPEPIYHKLGGIAAEKGYSLEQAIVTILAEVLLPGWQVEPVSEEDIAQQQAQFEKLRRNGARTAQSELGALLDEREPVSPESDLSPEVVAQVERRVKLAQAVNEYLAEIDDTIDLNRAFISLVTSKSFIDIMRKHIEEDSIPHSIT